MSTIPREVDGKVTPAPRYDVDVPGYDYPRERGEGWITFATVMLAIGGILGLIDGIVAVSKSSFYVAGANYVFSDLNTWGWIVMIVGAVTLCASFAVAAGAQWARWTGITVASLQAIAQLLMIQAYPLWSLSVFAIDLLVIYALAVYGGRRTRADI